VLEEIQELIGMREAKNMVRNHSDPNLLASDANINKSQIGPFRTL
jgi:hypothetical protein